MDIVLEQSPFIQTVTDLLRELDKAGFFSHDLLSQRHGVDICDQLRLKGDHVMTNETLTILIVDDEEPNRKLLSRFLSCDQCGLHVQAD